MQKKKYDLTSDLVKVSEGKNVIQEKKEDVKIILLTMSIEEELRAEFKSWCARHRLKMNEAFIKGFKLLKEKYGP
ncbi:MULTISPECIES: hypothetical protein [unclassified Rickettsia]|uniref:hypothetical protein n=1 Tax=unclassified Rickettsia TaxID=114295 RepID=UPI003132CA01